MNMLSIKSNFPLLNCLNLFWIQAKAQNPKWWSQDTISSWCWHIIGSPEEFQRNFPYLTSFAPLWSRRLRCRPKRPSHLPMSIANGQCVVLLKKPESPVSPNTIIKSKWPHSLQKFVFEMSRSKIQTWWYPLFKSNLSRMYSMHGIANLFLMVSLFNVV